MYFSTSGDILNLAIAAAIIGLALLIGWILVYFLIILRRTTQILHSIENGVGEIAKLITTAQKKLENSSAYLSAVALGIKELIAFFLKKQTSKTGAKKR